MINTPILVIGYNRPSVAHETLEMLAQSSPIKVYFAIDGPKNEKDKCLVDMVKEIYRAGIAGASCEYYENDFNQGPEKTITNAISEVFKKEDRLIILEDDVLAPYSFLLFAEKMLDLYAEDDRIAMVSGSNLSEAHSVCNQDYFFAYMGNTLSGWATWRRAWNDFNLYEDFHISRRTLMQRFRNKRMQRFFNRNYHTFSLLPRGINTWDCCWQFERIKNNKYSIIPRVNLTSNIGVKGTHFIAKTIFHNASYDESFRITNIVNDVIINEAWDEAVFKKFLSTPFPWSFITWICTKCKVIRLLYDEHRKQLQRT